MKYKLCIVIILFYIIYKLCVIKNDMRWVPLESTTGLTPNEEWALERMQNSRLVIAISCRDVPEDRIRKNIQMMEHIGSMFAEYRIIIFENDSVLNTRESLKDCCEYNTRIKLLTCELEGDEECKLGEIRAIHTINGDNHTKRVTKLARFRQKVFDEIKTNYSQFDYMLVFDIDLKVSMNGKDILSCFKTNDWGSIAAYSVKHNDILPFMYDPFATWLIDNDPLLKNENTKFRKLQDVNTVMNVRFHKFKGHSRMKVHSAFNGLCFYNLRRVIESNCRYVDEQYNSLGECEHVTFSRGLVNHGIPSYINFEWPVYVINEKN